MIALVVVFYSFIHFTYFLFFLTTLHVFVVYTWGRGEDGQLGLGDTEDQYTPILVEALTGKSVGLIACGSGHTVVLSSKLLRSFIRFQSNFIKCL